MKVAAFIGFLLSVSQFCVGEHFDLDKFKEELLENAKIASETLKRHPIDDKTDGALHDDTKRAGLDCTQQTGTCGGTYSSQDLGCIVSPDYGQGGYDNGLECVYNIKVSEGKRVELTIQDLDIESHSTCNWDRMEIVPGQGIFGALKVCGSVPPQGTFVSMADTMVVRLISDASVNGKGFAAKFTAISII
ncbi:protein SpAN-like [Patiria miniata]|uniref:CUB domain-containing protein n=1 Tax=Patiria miniata TaxID=46514 RepID=A0A914B734_PATMI|nr:protein SpAN-like [Patiria miniata]